MPGLNENDRLHATGTIQSGKLHLAVATNLDVHRNTIQFLWTRSQGNVGDDNVKVIHM